MRIRIYLLVLLLILSYLTPRFYSTVKAEDWIINGEKEIENETLFLSKNLVVEVGGELVIRNTNIVFNCSYEGEYGIDVNNGGELYIYNSTIGVEGEYGFHFYVNNGSILYIEDSKINNSYSSLHPLLACGSIVARDRSSITIRNCEFNGSGYITIYNGNATISGCYIHGTCMGIKTMDSNLTLIDSTLKMNLHGGSIPIYTIVCDEGEVEITGCRIENNVKLMGRHTIFLSGLNAVIRDCEIIQNTYNLDEESAAIRVSRGSYVISNVQIEYNDNTSNLKGRHAYGIYATEATIETRDCRINGCDYGVKNIDSQMIIKDSTIIDNYYGIYSENSQLIVEDTRVTRNKWGILSSSSIVNIQRCEITENTEGIWLKGENGTGSIHYCNIYNNSYDIPSKTGLRNSINTVIDARYNYWGSPNGPSNYGEGKGDRIVVHRGEVLYEPWLRQPANITMINISIEMPLLTTMGFVVPRVEPGRPSVEKVILKNEGNKDAEFLLAIIEPFYLEVLDVEGGEVIAEADHLKIIDVYLEAGEEDYLTIKFRVPPENVFGGNASLEINSKYIPCIVAEFAALSKEEWRTLREQDYNIDELLDKAWRITQERNKKFFNNFTRLPYNEQVNLLQKLDVSYPALADYIAWSIIYDKLDEELLSKEEVNTPLLTIPPVVKASSTQIETPTTAWGWTKWYVKEFFNKEFLPTAWEGLKGLGAGAVQSLTFGLVDIKAENDYMQVGKTIGSITTDVELTLLSLGGLGKTLGIKGVNLFSRMSKTTQYRTLLGIEARYSRGVYGNIIKIAENKRFGGWYLGIGHHRLKMIELASGKKIYPGWFHFYFSTGKIATWSPRAMSYVEMNLYSSAWNGFKRIAPYLLASSLVGDIGGEFKMISSLDPNYMESTPDKYIRDPEETIAYTIHFENLENATASAHNIRVEIPLDENLNTSSIQLVSSSHPDKLEYLNISNNEIEVLFKDIELPPNSNPPEGEGWITFKVKVKEKLESNTKIREKARVYFDYNPPIETNEVVLVYDDTPPKTTARVERRGEEITVSINGTDEGTGIDYVTLLVGEESGEVREYHLDINDTVSFKPEVGKTYYITSMGVDKAGNIEFKSKVDAIIETPSSPTWIIIVVFIVILIVVAITLYRKRGNKNR